MTHSVLGLVDEHMVTWKKKAYSLFSRYRIHYIKYIFLFIKLSGSPLSLFCTRTVSQDKYASNHLLHCFYFSLNRLLILFHECLWYFITCITTIRLLLWISHLMDANCPSLCPIVFNNSKFNTAWYQDYCFQFVPGML